MSAPSERAEGDQEVADEIAAAFKDDFISLLPVGVAGRDEPESKP